MKTDKDWTYFEVGSFRNRVYRFCGDEVQLKRREYIETGEHEVINNINRFWARCYDAEIGMSCGYEGEMEVFMIGWDDVKVFEREQYEADRMTWERNNMTWERNNAEHKQRRIAEAKRILKEEGIELEEKK